LPTEAGSNSGHHVEICQRPITNDRFAADAKRSTDKLPKPYQSCNDSIFAVSLSGGGLTPFAT
jgi:hypothetical protein